MMPTQKLAAILAAVQTDPGNRGLAELFNVCPKDFAAACWSIAEHESPLIDIRTGFFIASGDPPAFETDGPPGVVCLTRTCWQLDIAVHIHAEEACEAAIRSGLRVADVEEFHRHRTSLSSCHSSGLVRNYSHRLSIELPGPAADGKKYSMRSVEIPSPRHPLSGRFGGRMDEQLNSQSSLPPAAVTLAIGDGGNEIGMGKIPHETVVANIPNGNLIHCLVSCDHLIVAGVSNWGAYALAAGLFVLRGVTPPDNLFDPDREREILDAMVREGPLVDGVTGKQTATVDGLTWDEYAKPLVRIREILAS